MLTLTREELLEQRKTLEEAVFAAMYTLSKGKSAESWKMAVLKGVLEGLVPFLVAFNPTMRWPINTSNPVWQVVRWALPSSPIARIWGYKSYVALMYALAALIYTVAAAVVGLTLAMRKQEHSKWLNRSAALLQRFTDVMFGMLYVSLFDYMLFLFNCDYGTPGSPHNYWTSVSCFTGSHMITLVVAGVTAGVFFFMTALMLVAGCDLSPVAHGIMASPAAVLRLRVLLLKAAYVGAADLLGEWRKTQALTMVGCVALVCWYNLRSLPFLRLYVNDAWGGCWAAVLYTCCCLAAWVFDPDRDVTAVGQRYCMIVLYGVFPAAGAGAALTAAVCRWQLRVAPRFRGLDAAALGAVKLRKIHKFERADEVEVVARAMRCFDADGQVLADAAALGEAIIKCGLAMFPGNVGLLILHANFLMEVKHDGPAARTALQLALKGGPSLIQRYQIFSSAETSKRLKEGAEGHGGGLDLHSYVEFKRNYRAVIRMHKAALAAQRDFWTLLLTKGRVAAAAMREALEALEAAADTAHQVYKRVLERYPANGKLLRCYGKFLEDVRHDTAAAARAYSEAARHGGGDGLLSLDLKVQGSDKPDFLTSMDLHEDACMVINHEGSIMMVNSCVTPLLGYLRSELEGANVSLIMPQPFAGRHAGYMQRYVQGGEPHMLDTVRDVVALHKDRFVFPLQICVTKLSGVGSDSIFLGVLRPAPMDARNVRAWVAPNGLVLCTDPQFASLTGLAGEEMVGRTFQSLATDPGEAEAMMANCRSAPFEELAAGSLVYRLDLAHKFTAAVPVEITVRIGGTDAQRILILHARRTDGNTDGLLVVDTRGALAFATWDVAAMLGYPLPKLLKMKLDQLLPQPFATMHAKHLKSDPRNGGGTTAAAPPPTSCRAGALVHLVNRLGSSVPVRLKVDTRDDIEMPLLEGRGGGAAAAGVPRTLHVVQVRKADASSARSLYTDRRLVLVCGLDGRIVSVDNPESTVFGFAGAAVVGSNLADCIDVFAEWRDKAGAHQMELLLLSLLDKEAEMPGTSWRVKVHSPLTQDSLPAINRKGPPRSDAGRSACLQTEIIDVSDAAALSSLSAAAAAAAAGQRHMALTDGAAADDDDGPQNLARIILWRRDLLCGVVELDEQLTVRRADMDTGLIVGLPPSSLGHMPLHRLLPEVPAGAKWGELMKDAGGGKKGKAADAAAKKSALKGGAVGLVVSGPRAFLGAHPDGGTMRVLLQGVSSGAEAAGGGGGGSAGGAGSGGPGAGAGGGGGGRITATLHPDTAYVGARANVYRALGLEALMQRQEQQGQQGHGREEAKVDTEGGAGEAAAAPADGVKRVRAGAEMRRALTGEEEGLSGAPAAGLTGAAAEQGRAAGDGRGDSRRQPGTRPSDDSAFGLGDLLLQPQPGKGCSTEAAAAEDDVAAALKAAGVKVGGSDEAEEGEDGDAEEEEDDEESEKDGTAERDGAALHKKAQSQSDFVAQWVRTLSRQMMVVPPAAATAATAAAAAAPPPEGAGDHLQASSSRSLSPTQSSATPDAALDAPGGGEAAGADAKALALLKQNSAQSRQSHQSHQQPTDVETASSQGGDDDDDKDGHGHHHHHLNRQHSGGSASAGEPDAASVVASSVAGGGGGGADEPMVDGRRARLLKRLVHIISGPQLAAPLARLRRHTVGVLLVMLLTHVICYLLTARFIDAQFGRVHELHRLALAADRCQYVAIKASVAEFCSRPGIAPVSVCETPLNASVADLKSAVDDLELYHQTVYMGAQLVPKRMGTQNLIDLWTQPVVNYQFLADTHPERWVNMSTGLWQLGNRFIAAGRELIFWAARDGGQTLGLRPHQFLLANGPWSLFSGYATSLEHLAALAFADIKRLGDSVLILLVVEAVVVQLLCVAYQAWLVWRAELARVGPRLVGLALPGPVLRALANRPLVVLEDSDDEEENAEEGEEEGGAGGTSRPRGGAGKAIAKNYAPAATSSGAAAGVHHEDSTAAAAADPAAAPPLLTSADSGKLNTDGTGDGSAAAGQGQAPAAGGNANNGAHDDHKPPHHHLHHSGSGSGNSWHLGGGGGGSKGGGARLRRAGRWGASVRVNGKTLLACYRAFGVFMTPLLLWQVLLVVFGVISFKLLDGLELPLASLTMASHVIYRNTRVRLAALMLVAGHDAEERARWRSVLATEVVNLENEYDTLMYGGVAATQAGGVFQHAVPASTFESGTFSANFFKTDRCFRWDQSKCYTPDSPYYELTHHGLDPMMRRVLAEVHLLIADDDADVSYAGSRYTTLYRVGVKDMYEGLVSSAQLYVTYMIGRYDSIKLLHTILLIITVLFFVAYAAFLLRPYASATEREAGALAGLLSHVPPEACDVLTLAKQVVQSHGEMMGGAGGGDKARQQNTHKHRHDQSQAAAAGVSSEAPAPGEQGARSSTARRRRRKGASADGSGSPPAAAQAPILANLATEAVQRPKYQHALQSDQPGAAGLAPAAPHLLDDDRLCFASPATSSQPARPSSSAAKHMPPPIRAAIERSGTADQTSGRTAHVLTGHLNATVQLLGPGAAGIDQLLSCFCWGITKRLPSGQLQVTDHVPLDSYDKRIEGPGSVRFLPPRVSVGRSVILTLRCAGPTDAASILGACWLSPGVIPMWLRRQGAPRDSGLYLGSGAATTRVCVGVGHSSIEGGSYLYQGGGNAADPQQQPAATLAVVRNLLIGYPIFSSLEGAGSADVLRTYKRQAGLLLQHRVPPLTIEPAPDSPAFDAFHGAGGADDVLSDDESLDPLPRPIGRDLENALAREAASAATAGATAPGAADPSAADPSAAVTGAAVAGATAAAGSTAHPTAASTAGAHGSTAAEMQQQKQIQQQARTLAMLRGRAKSCWDQLRELAKSLENAELTEARQLAAEMEKLASHVAAYRDGADATLEKTTSPGPDNEETQTARLQAKADHAYILSLAPAIAQVLKDKNATITAIEAVISDGEEDTPNTKRLKSEALAARGTLAEAVHDMDTT
ncbi:hypothetical protein HXX76_014218 [Chlamydomonas incerta]|uniref:PAS domain-containing protein n=1 Tax=Chlamydomonas incerta TaxID=51695 RepID=A0A835SD63_CHLIN|nr:hypothetical protein HXX76_014218 [Chlamydomonas incerta]|eukprot:KAG2424794.1 hypothetical protein HXX76_014218 [Chlamydomonas incerta]